MHIIRAFTHLQVRDIPEKYIFKRYTRDAMQYVPWDRHDGVRIGAAASQEQARMLKLMPKLMQVGRAGSRSDRACEETDRQLDRILPGIEMFRSTEDTAPSTGPSTTNPADEDNAADGSPASGPSGTGSAITQADGSPGSGNTSSVLLHNDVLLVEPPVTRTKGRSPHTKKRKNEVENQQGGNPLSTYTKENYGNRMCSSCGVAGTHYSTTCPLNPDRSKALEIRLNKKDANPHHSEPRKRGRPKAVRAIHEEGDQDDSEVPATPSARGREGRGARGRGAAATRGRGRRGG